MRNPAEANTDRVRVAPPAVHAAVGPGRGRALPAVLLLPLAVLALRAIYLLTVSPYGLAGDEAHYWEWSRRLALSDYTKGPGIAWSFRASTAIFGDTVFAVKLPMIVAGSMLIAAPGAADAAPLSGRSASTASAGRSWSRIAPRRRCSLSRSRTANASRSPPTPSPLGWPTPPTTGPAGSTTP